MQDRLTQTISAFAVGFDSGFELDFSELQEAKRDEYFAAVQAGMDRDYKPMERIFNGVIERTLVDRR